MIGKLYNNSVGDLIEEAGDWYKIESGSCTGYVKAEYCVTGDEAKELAKKVGIRLARVKTTTLYVRSEPTRDSEVIGMVPMDDELEVLTEMPGWVKVSIEEGDGFVSDEYVKLHTEFVRAESKAEEEARLKREAEAREAARKAAAAAEKKAASKKKNSKTSGGDSGVTYTASGSGAGSYPDFFAGIVRVRTRETASSRSSSPASPARMYSTITSAPPSGLCGTEASSGRWPLRRQE